MLDGLRASYLELSDVNAFKLDVVDPKLDGNET